MARPGRLPMAEKPGQGNERKTQSFTHSSVVGFYSVGVVTLPHNDLMAEDAVMYEPLSAFEFPANREKIREFAQKLPI
jgi:hypothetical protein